MSDDSCSSGNVVDVRCASGDGAECRGLGGCGKALSAATNGGSWGATSQICSSHAGGHRFLGSSYPDGGSGGGCMIQFEEEMRNWVAIGPQCA